MVSCDSQTLEQLLSPDNIIRAKAQEWLDSLDFVPASTVLLNVLCSNGNTDIRGLAAVLLRGRLDRVISEESDAPYTKDGRCTRATAEVEKNVFIRNIIAPQILTCVTAETDTFLRQRISDVVAVIAHFFAIQGDDWETLWSFLTSGLTQQWGSHRQNFHGSAPSGIEDRRLAVLSLLISLTQRSSTIEILERRAEVLTFCLNVCLTSAEPKNEAIMVLSLLSAVAEGIAAEDVEGVPALARQRGELMARKDSQFVNLKTALRGVVPDVLRVLERCLVEFTEAGNTSLLTEELREILSYFLRITDAIPGIWIDHLNLVNHLLSKIALWPSISSGLGIVHKVPLPSAEELLDGTLHLVLGVVSAPDFPLWSTPDAEWLERREDDVLVDYNSDNVADVLVQLLSEFVELCASEIVDNCIIRQLVLNRLLQNPTSAFDLGTGARIVSLVIGDRDEAVRPVACSLLVRLVTLLNEHKVEDIQARWWLLMACCDILGRFGSKLRQEFPIVDALTVLVRVVQEDPVGRCKFRALACLYSFFASLEADMDQDFVAPLLAPVLEAIVVPALQTDNEEMQEMGLATAAVLAGLAGVAFVPYYQQFFDGVREVLTPVVQARSTGAAPSERHVRLCDAAVTLGVRLCISVPAESCKKDQLFMADHVTALLEAAAEEALQNSEIDVVPHATPTGSLSCILEAFPTFTQSVGALADAMGESFDCYGNRVVNVLWAILKQTEGIKVKSSDALGRERVDSGNEMSSALAAQLLSNIRRKKMDCVVQDKGTAQVVFKDDCCGEDHVFEFNTTIVEHKAAALKCFQALMECIPRFMVPFMPKTVPLLLCEVKSAYPTLRVSASEALACVLPCFLPDASETAVLYKESRCALRQGLVTLDAWFLMTQSLVLPLLDNLDCTVPQKAVHYLSALEEVLDSFKKGVRLQVGHERGTCGKSCVYQPENWQTFAETVFTAFGKCLVRTLMDDVDSESTRQQESELQTSTPLSLCCDTECKKLTKICRESHNASCCCDDAAECCDPYGEVYSAIIRGTLSLFMVFGEGCTPYFMTHLHTPYTGLLTLPEANMQGRISALYAYGGLMEFGTQETVVSVAESLIPVCLLYVRCNTASSQAACSSRVETQSAVKQSNDEAADDAHEDAGRVQAASYCIGVASQVAPSIFRRHIDSCLKALSDVLLHSASRTPERRAASDCSAGALIKIYLNPEYATEVASLVNSTADSVDNCSLLSILNHWFPFEGDEDESRVITDLLVSCLVDTTTAQSIYCMQRFKQDATFGPRLAAAISRGLSLIEGKMDADDEQRVELVSKDTWLSGRLYAALRLLDTLII